MRCGLSVFAQPRRARRAHSPRWSPAPGRQRPVRLCSGTTLWDMGTTHPDIERRIRRSHARSSGPRSRCTNNPTQGRAKRCVPGGRLGWPGHDDGMLQGHDLRALAARRQREGHIDRFTRTTRQDCLRRALPAPRLADIATAERVAHQRHPGARPRRAPPGADHPCSTIPPIGPKLRRCHGVTPCSESARRCSAVP